MYRQQQQQRPAGDGHMGVDKGGWGALRGKGQGGSSPLAA